MKNFYLAFLLFTSSLVFAQATGTSPEVGTTEGNLSVSLTGAAVYEIPIEVPPGVKGVVPKISLMYNSQGGNGIAGYGWDLSGISSIKEVLSTKFHDNALGPVNYDELDRFALDGQRLLITQDSPNTLYGGNQTVYETENFSNVRITSYNNNVFNKPDYFIVRYPDGSLAQYGNVSSSKSGMEYAINYWQDALGNRITYNYTSNNGALSITKITYGSNTAIVNEINFLYSNRARKGSSSDIGRFNILTRIEIKSSGVVMKNYVLNHDITSLGYERLIKITEKSGDNSLSYNPTVFAYDTTTNENLFETQSPTTINLSDIDAETHSTSSGDYNGDGKTDFIMYKNNEKNKFWIFKNLQSSTDTGLVYNSGNFDEILTTTQLTGNSLTGYKVAPKQGWLLIQPPLTTDVNTFKSYILDDNSVVQENSVKNYRFPQFNSITKEADWTGGFGSHLKKIEKKFLSGDFNGDGLTDVIALEPRQNISFLNANGTQGTYYYSGDNVYFINLDKRLQGSIGNIAGSLIIIDNLHKVTVGDVNGDGKDDVVVLTNGRVEVFSLNDDNQLQTILSRTDATISIDRMVLFGDFNGDRKMDFVIPEAVDSFVWRFYIYDGTSYSSHTQTLESRFINSSEANWTGGLTENSKSLNEVSYVANDFNGDGRTDILIQQNLTAVAVFENGGWNYNVKGLPLRTTFRLMENVASSTRAFTFKQILTHPQVTGVKKNPIAIFSNHNEINQNLEYTLISGNQVRSFKSPKDNRIDVLLKSITTGNGVKETITYSSLVNQPCGTGCNSVYLPQPGIENYPNVNVNLAPTFKVVSKLENQSATVNKKQLFAYSGAVSNVTGLGFLGFKATMRTNWHDASNTNIISNIAINDISLRGANSQSYSISGLVMPQFTSYANYISKTVNTYNLANDPPLLANKVFKLKKTKIEQYNGLENTSSIMSITYDEYNNPIRTLTTIKEGTSLVQTTTNEVTYDNQPTGSTYIIGRTLTEKQSIVSEPEMDLDYTESRYSYINNLLTQIKKRGSGTEFITEDNAYDAFGNIITKTVSASGLAPRITKYEYGTASPYYGRFLTKSYILDSGVEKLTRQFTYDPVSGNLLTEFDLYGNVTTNTYDKWYKLIKTIQFPGKETTITYTKPDQMSSMITIDGNDGSSMIAKYDDLGRKIVEGAKQVNDTWSYVKTEYDIYDRVVGISEPYSSLTANVSKWNTTTYDAYGRPNKTVTYQGKTTNISYSGLTTTTNDGLKTVSTTKDAVGNVVLMNEGASSVVYKYFPNGNLKLSDYGGAKIEIQQDEWGRRKKLKDSSAGEYNYSYNLFGDLTNEQTPNGETQYQIGPWGEVLEKTVVGSAGIATNTKSTYFYETDTKQLKRIEFDDIANGLEINYDFGYDQYKRLNFRDESGYMSYFQQATQYDALSRPLRELYTAMFSETVRSDKWILNTYKNGYPYQLIQEGGDLNVVLWQTNGVNERGQLTSALMGNGMRISRTYDQYGFPTQIKYFKSFIGRPTPPDIDYLTLNYSFNSPTANLTSRSNSSFNFNETYKYDNLDRLTEYTNSRGLQESQSYDNRGRITQNNIGTYNYSTEKPYRNNSIDINAEAIAYFKNRQGIFNDGMEEQKGWTTYYHPATSVYYDNSKSNTGNYSLKVNNTVGSSERVVESEQWISIDNSVPTEYKFSTWVYSDGPQYELFMFMSNGDAVTPVVTYANVIGTTTGQWVPLEGTFIVPAGVKRLKLRVDNNGNGNVWFDDVRITKAGSSPTGLRELNISYSAFKAPVQIEETDVDKISFVYNEFQGRSSMFYGGLETDKMQRQFRKHYSADGTMEIKHNQATGKVEFITYIGGDGYSAPIVFKSDGTNSEYLYLLRDYQGTILEIYNGQTVALEKRIFDAWGRLIKVQDGQGNILSKMSVLDRGYTGHEHLQSIGVIHMNGRLYDPILHRFLQPDNDILDPSNTQNYNRYGYVLNNPLKYTDPTGENQQNNENGNGWTGTSIGAGVAFIGLSWDALGIKDGFNSGTNWASNNIKSITNWFSNNFKSLFGGERKNISFPASSASFLSNYGNGSEFTFKSSSLNTGYVNNVIVHPYIATSSKQSEVSESVGQPGEWESIIPIWGSGRAAVDHFQNGNYWRGIGYSALAISDVFMVKAAYTAIAKGVTIAAAKISTKGGSKYVYRALTSANAESLSLGKGIFAKAPGGSWTLEEHIIHGSNPKALLNDPWIATTLDKSVARRFSSGNGIVRINLSKLPASSIQRAWMTLPRSSRAYHLSIWQQEVSIFQHIPQNAIKIIK